MTLDVGRQAAKPFDSAAAVSASTATTSEVTGSAGPKAEMNAGTVSLAREVILYTSKDRKHENPLRMLPPEQQVDPDFKFFEDAKGNRHQYLATDNENTFKDHKDRTVYAFDSKEFWAARTALRDRVSSTAQSLRDADPPRYVKAAARVGAVVGGGGTFAGASATGVGALVPAAVGATAGAVVLGGAAIVISDVQRKSQFVLRNKLATFEATGVERRAESVKHFFINSSKGGKSAAAYELLFNIGHDVRDLAEREAGKQLERMAKVAEWLSPRRLLNSWTGGNAPSTGGNVS